MLDVEVGSIEELIETGQFEEGVTLEAKLAGGNIPRSAWESIGAFANTDGGLLVLGLGETEDGWDVQGVADPEKMKQDIANMMRDRTKISFNVSGNQDIWIETVRGKRLVVIRVPRAPRRHRPVLVGNKAYVRNGQGDALCTEEEFARMTRDATPSRADQRVLPYLGLDDFDRDAIERYRQLSQIRRPELANHIHQDLRAYLQSIRAWRKDREQGDSGPTVAGILMFGTDEAILQIRPNHVIDYRRVRFDQTPATRYAHRVRWLGHLFGAWESIYPPLTRGLPTPFRLRGPHRIDQPGGLDSLREALVNLLVHTDYEDQRDAVILHRDDGYLFENPGDSWVDPQDLGIQDRSERRNPAIAQMFDNAGLADQAGSGFIRILDEWKAMGFRKPTIASDSARYQFQLEMTLASLLPGPERLWLSSIGGPWREDEELALVFARQQGYVDNATLRAASGQHLFDASQTLRSLRDRGYLLPQGAGKNTSYVLGAMASEEFDREISEHGVIGIGHDGSDLGHKSVDRGHSVESSGHSVESSGHSVESSGHSDRQKEEWNLVERALSRLAEPIAKGQRAAPKEVEDVIVRLCEVAPLSSGDLSRLLRRSTKTIYRYLNFLIASGRIETSQDSRRHPEQRYRAKVHSELGSVIQKEFDL